MACRMPRSLPPAAEVADGEGAYQLSWLTAPVLTGRPLRLLVAVLESSLGPIIVRKLLRDNGMPQVLQEVFIPEKPTFTPNTRGWDHRAPPAAEEGVPQGTSPADAAAAAAGVLPAFAAEGGSEAAGQSRVAEFHAAYRSGRVTPVQVAEAVIAALAESEAQDPPMRFLIAHNPAHLRQQAAASTERWAAGKPLSVLDGVPFAVKDIVDALPYPTTAGTAFLAEWRPAARTNPSVQALLDAGALMVGKANLHEIGLGTTGLNTVHGTPRNPHNTAHHTGASSSGSAAIVAAGICPIAIGTDGGGSIRIPSSLCGVVGLKVTHDRVCTKDAPSIDQTVAVVGPMAAMVQDCLLMYAVMSNQGHDQNALPPPLKLPSLAASGSDQPLRGVTAGIYWEWFEDSAPEVVGACKAAVTALQLAGLAVKPVRLPELDLLRAAHSCTITTEMRNNMTSALLDGSTRRCFNLETRASLAVAGGFDGASYVQAQKIRTRVEAHFRKAFREVDIIITPTTPTTAPCIKRAALHGGESDLGVTTSLMRYMLAPNFLGLPAISVPVSSTANPACNDPAAVASRGIGNAGAVAVTAPDGIAAANGAELPIGLQVIAPCWEEALLLHVALVLERAVGQGARPAVWWDVLQIAATV